ncbi:potassium channel family protein [Chitinibacteraceae bacterium HSL-7]
MPNVFFLVMRRMRAPLITLILIYATAVLGLVMIPGIDSHGQPYSMDFFHAFYFVSYTATTIGFGETPHPFTYTQRMWVVVCIYLSVVGWAYTIGTIFSILQDKSFQQAVQLARFASRVRRMGEPFFLICGYGQTARLLCRVLDDQDIRFVVVEKREERIHDVTFADYRFDVPSYAGDASNPELLTTAGITHPQCRGVLAITGDEEANLAVTIAAYVLRPKLLSVGRAKTRAIAENMASFGTNRVINMFDAVGSHFQRALHAPQASRLWDTLTDFPGQPLPALSTPPRGHWIIVGFGRFGHAIKEALDCEGATVTVVDEEEQPRLESGQHVRALGVDEASLRAAGIEHAVGIVACHDQDVHNLSAIATARQIKPGLFVVARQNLASNGLLFRSFKADVTVVRSEVMSHECLRAMTTPTLARFLALIGEQDEAWAAALLERLTDLCRASVPMTWIVQLDGKSVGAVHALLAQPYPRLTLEHLMTNPQDERRSLRAQPLLLLRGSQEILLPTPDTPLLFGDTLLFAGTAKARSAQQHTLSSYTVMDYVRTGTDQPAGYVFRRLHQWQQQRQQDS